MGRPSTASKKSADYADAIAQWAADITRDHGLEVRLVVTRATRARRLRIRAQACHVAEDRLAGIQASVETEYPNGDAATLEATLLAAVVKLHAVLDEPTPIEKAAGM